MCDFVSWIEKDNKVLFLTHDLVFNTEKGKLLRDWCKSTDDYCGHGAIRYYYGLERDHGKDRECTDFTTTANFPYAIVKAIKAGKMGGIGFNTDMLNDKARAEYAAIRDKAYAEYHAVYDKAWAEHIAVCEKAFWDLFDIPENRIKAWR